MARNIFTAVFFLMLLIAGALANAAVVPGRKMLQVTKSTSGGNIMASQQATSAAIGRAVDNAA